jgi:adenylate kinase
MNLIFLGPPGAGKGTQARLLEQRFGVRQISTGDILRGHRERGTDLGKQAESYMKSGALVPDELIVAMIESELTADQDAAGFVMDGFPRTVAQAKAFDALLERRGWPLDAVVLFNADRATLIERLSARWSNPRNGRTYNSLTNPPKVAGIDDDDGGPLIQREDDKAETVAKRLDIYESSTVPLIDYYRAAGLLVEVDGLAPVQDVAHELIHALQVEHAH